ncbi:hypothetical protein PAHAL_1G109900 [Panicum hallii]|uniref:Uncharacterized protein n=1 Tax=Panicum hallii TaxID=206008 RepID=A0A2T8KUU9_9POAL|nr:hypothetical protein PAHAL_1G109900 [Panicum hallii]
MKEGRKPQVLPEEKKLQVIRDYNLWHEGAGYKVDGGSFERDKGSLQIPPEIPLHEKYQSTLPSRCLLNCPMVEKKAYLQEPKVVLKESNHLEGDERCVVGTLQRRVGKDKVLSPTSAASGNGRGFRQDLKPVLILLLILFSRGGRMMAMLRRLRCINWWRGRVVKRCDT